MNCNVAFRTLVLVIRRKWTSHADSPATYEPKNANGLPIRVEVTMERAHEPELINTDTSQGSSVFTVFFLTERRHFVIVIIRIIFFFRVHQLDIGYNICLSVMAALSSGRLSEVVDEVVFPIYLKIFRLLSHLSVIAGSYRRLSFSIKKLRTLLLPIGSIPVSDIVYWLMTYDRYSKLLMAKTIFAFTLQF